MPATGGRFPVKEVRTELWWMVRSFSFFKSQTTAHRVMLNIIEYNSRLYSDTPRWWPLVVTPCVYNSILPNLDDHYWQLVNVISVFSLISIITDNTLEVEDKLLLSVECSTLVAQHTVRSPEGHIFSSLMLLTVFSCILSFRCTAANHLLYFISVEVLFEMLHDSHVFQIIGLM